jgi:protocatechuate 3,4-dioxygenase beta subunit
MGFDRRIFLRGAGAIVGCALGRAGLAEAAEVRSGRAATTRKEWEALVGAAGQANFNCVPTAEILEGPFYYESSPLRSAIAERHQGERVRLGITVAGMILPNRCMPLTGAIVDIWQTDGVGLYSNVGPDLQNVDTVGQSFLRGHQVTDENGYVEFDTLVPGWEIMAAPPPLHVALRTTHVHVKVFHEREVLTTQLFFPDALLDDLYANVEPYKSHRAMTAPGLSRPDERIANGKDRFYLESNSQPVSVAREHGVLVAKATIGVMSQGNLGIKPLFR